MIEVVKSNKSFVYMDDSKTQYDSTSSKTEKVMRYGQHDKHGGLNGLGRKIKIWANGADVWEGQFKQNELHGFGRQIKIHPNDKFSACQEVQVIKMPYSYSCTFGYW